VKTPTKPKKKTPVSAVVESHASRNGSSERAAADRPAQTENPVRHAGETPAAGKNHKTALRTYRFQRAKTPGIIEVLNENSYVMAEYSERTGSVKWQRIVLASQREQIEKWLDDHYSRT